MKKLFISDLHLGSPLFKKEYQITQLFNCSNYKEIYILGDVIDTWEDDLNNITEQYRRLIIAINHSPAKVFILKGNHDPSVEKLKFIFHSCEVTNKIEIYLGDKKVIMVHGDEFDDAIIKYSWVAKMWFPLHWLLERFGINIKGYLRELFHSIAKKKDNKHYNDIITEIEKRAVEKYKDYSVIIMGHTHLAKMVYTSTPIYLNAGSMLVDPSCIEYDNGVFTKREI
jgi:UDP-2,3-diacylglucosamine pyrophosphatase LpxH